MQRDTRDSSDLDGIEETDGLSVGPLRDLPARITSEGERVAYEAATLDAAAQQRAEDPAGAAALRSALKALKSFPLKPWEKAVDVREREARRVEKARAQREAAAQAKARREALDRARAEASAATTRARAQASADVARHHGEHVFDDDSAVRVVKEPGRTTVERPTKREGVETRTLAGFSADIVREARELDAPDAPARRTFHLSIMLPGDSVPRLLEPMPADEFREMRWVEKYVGARGIVYDIGRRDDLRVAIQAMSSPEEVYSYRFTGWVMHRGVMVYLHKSGAIGPHGAVEGVRSEVTGSAASFDFGDLSMDPARGVRAIVDLLSVEPAPVMVTLMCAAFRSMMGPSSLTVHVYGGSATGKSLRVGLVQSMFGRTMHGDALPASWADKSTDNALFKLLSTVGDAVVTIDDYLLRGGPDDIKIIQTYDTVTRAHHNRAAPLKLNRDGSQRFTSSTRGTIFATGESPPRGLSTLNRVVALELPERPPGDLTSLMQRAAEGELARGMAAAVRWYASQVEENLPRLDAMERDAAARWNLGGGDRATKLFGALVLGAEHMLAWLAATGVVAPRDLERHETRVREAIAAVARERGANVEAENPARRFLPLLCEALRAGEAHVKALRPDGKTGAPDAGAEAWGWRSDGHDGPKQQGKAVGWIKGAEVYVLPGDALDVVRTRAARAGHPVPADAGALARDLHAAGLLARTDLDKARRRFTARSPRVYGSQHDVLVFSAAAFGAGEGDDDRSDEPTRPGAQPPESPATRERWAS